MTATKSWRAWSSTVHVVVDDDRTLPDAAETLNDILDRVDRVFDRLSTRGMSCHRPRHDHYYRSANQGTSGKWGGMSKREVRIHMRASPNRGWWHRSTDHARSRRWSDCCTSDLPTMRIRQTVDSRSAFVQLLGEHHDDAAGAADIGELVDVLVGRHTAQRVAAMLRGDLKGFVDVVD
jgi:hypothetical protein